jgi:hypothetical protein
MYPRATYSREAKNLQNPMDPSYQTFSNDRQISYSGNLVLNNKIYCTFEKALQGLIIIGIISIIPLENMLVRLAIGMILIVIQMYLLVKDLNQ